MNRWSACACAPRTPTATNGSATIVAYPRSCCLRDPVRDVLRDELADPRLERAIGVVYRPDTELASHYFQAILPAQFDEYIWFDESTAVRALSAAEPRHTEMPHPLA